MNREARVGSACLGQEKGRDKRRGNVELIFLLSLIAGAISCSSSLPHKQFQNFIIHSSKILKMNQIRAHHSCTDALSGDRINSMLMIHNQLYF